MADRVKVTVERSKWIRGEGPAKSRLLRPSDGKMCCLGFACLALGVPVEAIADKRAPGSVDPEVSVPRLRLRKEDKLEHESVHPEQIGQAMVINDTIGTENGDLVDETCREAALTTLLAEVGIDLEFVD